MKLNFVIAGAPKCGSTTLYRSLSAHPEICMSVPKQPQIFTDKRSRTPEIHNFFSHYKDELLLGEASVDYFNDPQIPKRMRAFNPDMKIVFILRDPVERFFSHYWFRLARGREFRSWKVALQEDSYLFQYGFYYKNIYSYAKEFSKGNIHIIILEEFIRDPSHEMQKLFDFLNVKNYNISSGVWENKGAAIYSTLLTKMIWQIRNSPRTLSVVPAFLLPFARGLRKKVERLNEDSLKNKRHLLVKARPFLTEIFKDDVNDLENYLQRKLPWNFD